MFLIGNFPEVGKLMDMCIIQITHVSDSSQLFMISVFLVLTLTFGLFTLNRDQI